MNYPVVRSEGEQEAITCAYSENQVVVRGALAEGKTEIVFNGTGTDSQVMKLPVDVTVTCLDADGATFGRGNGLPGSSGTDHASLRHGDP